MTFIEEFTEIPDFSYPDFSVIHADYGRAEAEGMVSPNHLPVGRMLGSTQLDAYFACMASIVKKGLVIPAEPSPVRGATNLFDDRASTPRDGLDATPSLADLSEIAEPEDGTHTEVADVEVIVRPSKLLKVFRRAHPHTRAKATKPNQAEVTAARRSFRGSR